MDALRVRRWIPIFAMYFIAGCAHVSSLPGTFDSKGSRWAGRLSVRVQTDPPQTLSAQFELQGGVDNGTLVLTSPLGTTMASIQWDQQQATLQMATEVQRFDSLDALTRHVSGTELPVLSLFSWLNGKSTESPGWSVDSQDLSEGRLSARRFSPPPVADLKIILER